MPLLQTRQMLESRSEQVVQPALQVWQVPLLSVKPSTQPRQSESEQEAQLAEQAVQEPLPLM